MHLRKRKLNVESGATGRHFQTPSVLEFREIIEVFDDKGRSVCRESKIVSCRPNEIDGGEV